MARLQGKVVFVAGGSEGIGGATAERLAEEGAKVVVCARRPEPLAALADRIRGEGGDVETLTLDVGDLDALAATIADIARRHGRLDGLVHNAVIADYGMLVDMPLSDWRRMMNVNLDAVFVSTQAAMRVMQAQGSGAIVHLSSILATHALAGTGAYSAAKAGLMQLTRVAAIEGGPHNVRVNAIAPGFLDSPGARRYGDAEQIAKIGAATPIPHIGEGSDGANAILYLLSDEARYVTGICIPVDGGKAVQLYVPG